MLSRRLVSRLGSRAVTATRTASTSSSVPAAAPDPPSQQSSVAPAPQAPNAVKPWSTSQRPRPQGRSGPRFEQTKMELQPNPLSAMAMISEEPTRIVHGRKAVCDGGGGPLGHPKIFINLDQPGPHTCGYCGLRFEQAPHHGHHE
ncbi:hypothetical protein GLOTRDRAFT_68441 [Gloeophyllum trabeum ATCC 11539]|uniref:Zinc finger CHCC-type domain-containing protein n=1 Tax=Gloeophyllum trabeum (strain ATCC 11539 / FP-39264 / Madison 617) TaxID=670483 RepID=S7QMK1_GLOTA|nr:uncharacterized protein GLOTRDRAFT_68441 [Gloeophyllum trabeum ATCC 11539]EPQ60632.1 hypothetical protein GLOTRDRAFT_68441 [Gloeophyllum trabeum ATCC 11539]